MKKFHLSGGQSLSDGLQRLRDGVRCPLE